MVSFEHVVPNKRMTDDDGTCPVCVEPFTACQRKRVTCAKCEHTVCRKCMEQYLLTTMDAPHCMACRVGWDAAFVAAHSSSAFHNQKLRAHHAQLLLEREKGFLPETVPFVERYRQRQRLQTECDRHAARIRELQEELNNARTAMWRLQCLIRQLSDSPASQTTEEARQFIRACPLEDCRGFLSTAWKCGVCETYFCPQCHGAKTTRDDPHHTCNPDDVETAALLRRETKPCPSCGVAIFKIDGCDQMWCTACATPFSWRTGQIIKNGIIHNPHYFEWQRQNHGGQAPRHPLDQPCGGRLQVWDLRRALAPAHHAYFCSALRVLRHIEDINLRETRHRGLPEQYRELRIQFLLRMITEDEWCAALRRLSKKAEKQTAIEQILRMLVDVGSDIIRRATQREHRDQEATFQEQLEALRRYANGELGKVGAQFHNKVPLIYLHRRAAQWVLCAVGTRVATGWEL